MNAEEYSKMFALEDRYWWFVGRRNLALALLSASVPAGGEYLDVGCGTGAVLSELNRLGVGFGLDFSDDALRYSGERGISRLVRGNGEKLPFTDGSFDAVVGLDVFEHIPDDVAAFREAYRVLKPGACLVLSVPAFPSLWGPHDVALHHFRRYRRRELCDKLQDAGFEIQVESFAVFWLFPLVLLSRVLDKLKRGPAKAHLPVVPELLNRLLIRLLDAEGGWIAKGGRRWPWGSSLVVVAKKPNANSEPRA